MSASKVVTATAADVVKAFSETRRRNRWLAPADAELSKALTSAIKSRESKGFVVRPDGLGRYRYKWGGTIVQFHLVPKPGGKVSVVVTNSKLSGVAMVESRRAQWRTALNGLAELLNG